MDSDTPIPDVTPVIANNASLADGIDGIMGRSKTDRMKLRPPLRSHLFLLPLRAPIIKMKGCDLPSTQSRNAPDSE
jgi:hypothetical protein